ncbi:uncharacterized protein LOC110683603 isoform X1 [Chenopodium quinoa]|uniref:uncharacterized protein LOC110683603 isoform X1 n=1 Tax=Chenopodium quinoa TaxID=63459 RepID=UPI000B791CF4|nr:uncharacterized protein LOC110683603 isoform X1 [Chenopodium quinoa]
MDSRHRRQLSSDRFMNTLKIIPPSSIDAGDELSEDDVFFTGANFQNPPSTSSTPPPLHHRRHHKSYNSEAFGILAALPESGDEIRPVLNHKPLISPPPPPSSSRMIPNLPRPSIDRQIFSLPEKYHQSAPLNVPMRPLLKNSWRQKRFEDVDDGVVAADDDDGEMLPPHEIVARQLSKSPVLSSSVLEGAGRTLKGRDLRQVRNAVFRQTGFID